MPQAHLFAKIAKVDATKREVHGVLAEEAVDKAKEIFDYNESKPYFQKWNESFLSLTAGLDVPSVGNVREMHTKSAAGKFIKMDYDDVNKSINVIAKIEDDQAWRKVCTGVYTGFSIGGDYVRKFDDPLVPGAKRYVAMPTEGSLVDNPCMYGATFKLFKSEGDHEIEELVKFVGEGELAKAGKTKRVDGYDLSAECFLIVGDTNDTSTWHLPVHFPTAEDTVRHIQMAMGDLPLVSGVTHQVKSGAARRLNSLAHKHGVETKDFTTKFLESTYPNALKKCMYSVSTMASTLESLSYLEQNLQYEAENEGDDSKVPEQLRTAIKDLSQIFLDMAEEETKELAAKVTREEPATKVTEPNLTKGGGPNMPPTEQVKNGTGEGQSLELKKYQDEVTSYKTKLTNISTGLGKLVSSTDEIRKSQEDIDDALANLSVLGKSATAKDYADTFELIKASAGKIKGHSDQTEAVIEEMESEAEDEANNLTNNQKSTQPTLLIKRMERQFERRMANQQRMHEASTNALLSGIEKMFSGGNAGLAKAAEPSVPARTFVAPDKTADGAGVGGVVLQKSAPTGSAAPVVDGVAAPAVDHFGMPDPNFVEKADGSQFLGAVKKAQLHSGNPFPKEFGNSTIF